MERVDHHFSPDLAVQYGVPVSIFMRNIYFWAKQNKGNGKHFHDGRYWTYNSMESFRKEAFPYWTRRQIERIIEKCREAGLLVTGCYNSDPRDRTQWYSPTEKALKFFCDDVEGWFSDAPYGEMQTREVCRVRNQTVEPLPDNKPDNKQEKEKINKKEKAPAGEPPKKPSKYALAEDAKPILRSYVGEDLELAHALADLIEIREKIRAVNSAKAIRLLLNELDKLSGGRREDKLLILRQSIMNSWKSVFPLKWDRGGGAPPGVQAAPEPTHWGWD